MAQIINSTYVTVDGLIADPQDWPQHNGFDESAMATQMDLLMSAGALVMGRRTYDSFAEAWPTRSGDPYSDKFNAMPKYVVSTTLSDPEWNNSVVLTDPAADLRRIKGESEQNIVQYGYGPVTKLLVEHDLLDELHLWVYPVLMGQDAPADRLVQPGLRANLDLVESKALTNGIIWQRYSVAR